MANRIKINHAAFARATLQSAATRRIVADLTEAVADRARSQTSDEIITAPEQGIKRARGYVRRLGSGAAGEAKDGALSRSL